MLGMRQVSWVAAAVLAFGAIGCGGDDKDDKLVSPDDTEDTDAPGTDTGSSVGGSVDTEIDQADVEAALLAIDDLPAGWAEVPLDEDDDDPLCGVDTSDLLDVDEDELPKAEVEFAEDADTGPGFFEGIAWPPEGRAEELMDKIEQKLDDCDNTELDDMQITVGGLSTDQLGDESFAFRISVAGQGVQIDLDTIYIRQGNLVMTVSGFDILGDPTAVMSEWATKALEKASAALVPGAGQ